MTIRRRARGARAKAARRNAMLNAARARYHGTGIAQIPLSGIASDAGVVKGTVYLYFRTKEEVFLGLAERELDAWFDEVDRTLAGVRRLTAPRLADLFAASLTTRSVLRRLLADLGPLIEPQVSHEALLRFRWRLVGRMTAAAELLERGAVFLRPGDGLRLLIHVQALAAGLQSQVDPAGSARPVLDAPGMEPLRTEFDAEFRAALGALLQGLERTN